MSGDGAMAILCRETDKRGGGRIAVYVVGVEATARNINNLSIRSRYNPELQYFVAAAASAPEAMRVLKRKRVTTAAIERIGGIEQL